MVPKCPGQDSRDIKSGILACPDCGYKLEIFSDEIKVSCPKCKSLVYRQGLPSCVDWCKSARDCIGEKRWDKLREGR